jgi:1-acyl-sn-glycerol-3-phosphate acyltransferase
MIQRNQSEKEQHVSDTADQWKTHDGISFRDTGYGFDEFGLSPSWVTTSARTLAPVYDKWFRVKSYGNEHVPTEGAAILASNHSGTLPFDGAMIYMNVMRETEPTRILRVIADHFVSKLPFVGAFYSRVGVVGGSRGNFRRLLENGELLLVFPEGVPGISKPFGSRYELQKWRVGHVELAIRHQCPVIPVAVIGAEEQMPQIGRIPIHMFGSPFLPLTLVPFPLPVQYHIHYGAAIPIQQMYRPEQADDPDVLQRAAAQVKAAVQQLIERGLSERTSIF